MCFERNCSVMISSFSFSQEYRLSARAGIGVDSLPDGREYYVKELSYHLTDPGATPEEVHAMGLGEVQRISREMEEVSALLFTVKLY